MRLTADDHRKFADVGFLVLDAARPLAVKAGGAATFNPLTPHNLSDAFGWSSDASACA
ncbi:hypothetical protein JQX09_06640 [Sulfitobacter pseudonitzschiae]|uniref:Uncharacterized protein n=1 Tax=Pseudosulfitobacter pseudonitzschiae TaxID=1402135 RepID=A0A9Q2NMM9_9RHOB|nr:hypothetical protein [Pseudosulfitobacter pseudonitzschiae]MBM2291579.1 hypothetical protein [Pseudosulfitobacter pseudonitzschiae]MBM2296497.1 hypothetical protein [Pseudosulfitobacter pseudonitzschiae]MBM2301410.1 hypothetical protein [Pseudosulfitobacter pseudonitzschiae]MBM2311194.1 hypothetical protein [Pseudosulfitobacter pseudonitzschiae]MBM2316107.1 hypothetical protein [Pseudosulfitobacter pseudonitzschiae]